MERRDRLGIIADILDKARDGIKKTELMYKSKLSFTQVQGYSKVLAQSKLLYINGNNGNVEYKTSEKGYDFVEKHRNLIAFFKD